MYRRKDRVLKKNVTYGVCEGTIENIWLSLETDDEYIRVLWDDSYRSSCKAASVLPHTPENIAMLEARYDKRCEKIDRQVAAIMAMKQQTTAQEVQA